MENKNKPAFAAVNEETYLQEGLTKLEYFTAMALSGLCANMETPSIQGVNGLHVVAVQIAEKTLNQIEKKS